MRGNITLTQKYPLKEIISSNNRSITCLPISWKMISAQIKDVYYSLACSGLFPEDQNIRCKSKREIVDLSYIDQQILKEVKIRQKI